MAKTTLEKEQALLDKIGKAKKSLNRLKDKRRKEIGVLAMKAGLSDIDDDKLLAAFQKLAKELVP